MYCWKEVWAIDANGVVMVCKLTVSQFLFGEQGLRIGESACLPPVWWFNSSPVPYVG